ncbi:MAG: homoserine kinase [Pyrinomonadaceae bacterium]
MDEVRVASPASVSNVVCGFDCLGFALTEPFDEVTIRKINERTVRIRHLDNFGLPTDPERNVAGVALLALARSAGIDFGFEVEITKGIKPGSGIGSSASSSSGAVVAANRILNDRFSKQELVEFAMQGERLASGAPHADNVAPCIYGGFTLVRSIEPLDIVSLEFATLYATVIHPQIEIRTSDARDLLPKQIPLSDAIRQWSNLGAFVAALARGDHELLSRSMEDLIVEPARKSLIPKFDEIKAASLAAGAIGGGISGSGPSIFMLSASLEDASKIVTQMRSIFEKTGIEFKIYSSDIGRSGVRVL